jgi:hypothetical protein
VAVVVVLSAAALPAAAAKAPSAGGVLAKYEISPHNLSDAGGTVTFTATGVRNATKGCVLRVGGATSLVRGVTVKGVAVNGMPVLHAKKHSAMDFPIAQNAACPASVTANAVIAGNDGRSRAHVDFTLQLFSTAVDKSHKTVTATRSFGTRGVGVAATRNVAVRNVSTTPAVVPDLSGAAGTPGTQLQVTADVANAKQCTVTSRVLETGGVPGTAVANLKDFESVALSPGTPVDCSSAGTAKPAHVTATLGVPAVQLADGARCGYVKLYVTVGATGNGSPRSGHTFVTVSSGDPHC